MLYLNKFCSGVVFPVAITLHGIFERFGGEVIFTVACIGSKLYI
jgi:hypothetical protein